MSTTAVDRLNAALSGRYRIERELGQGGMATVYLAEDLRHERKVALKVLKPELAAVVGAERFLAEIKTTANLQHPHILPLHDSGEADGFLFYVMPYVEGESLRERLAREKQLPVDEAVRIATDVAEALQSAHQRGVIHRDVKPANILLSEGRPLVADFGIALAISAAGGGRLTETGLSVGTPFYMSPEQASADREPSAASDVYSLACVLYEMLVGEPPYTGSSAQAVLARILTDTAKTPSELRPSIPPNVDAAVRRALERLPADRFASARDFAAALTDPAFTHFQVVQGSDAGTKSQWNRLTLGFASAAAVLALGWGLSVRDTSHALQVARFKLDLAPNGVRGAEATGVDIAISPDGSRIVYRGPLAGGGSQLWERLIDDIVPRPVPGTEGYGEPAISPDGASLAFSGANLYVKSFQGGPPRAVASPGNGAAFGYDGAVYYRVAGSGAIWRAPLEGGDPEPFTTPMEGVDLRYPDALPGGGLLVTINQVGSVFESVIGAVGPEGGEVRELFPGAMARYAASGHIVYTTEEGSLLAIAFDEKRLQVEGSPITVVEGVVVKTGSASQFALSNTGTLVYVSGELGGEVRPVWVDRAGAVRDIDPDLTISGPTTRLGLALSPDGDRLAYSSVASGIGDVWVKELDGGPRTKLTLGRGDSYHPTWSADGSSVAFVSNRTGQLDIWSRRADGSGDAEVLLRVPEGVREIDLSPVDDWMVYRVGSVTVQGDLHAARIGSESAPIPLLTTEFSELNPTLSPDGRWLAYRSDHSGQPEVYVRPFPNVDSAMVTISTDGGSEPVWSRDGTELFYRSGGGELTVARIEVNGSFDVISRTALFRIDTFLGDRSHQLYDVSVDGSEFVMLQVEPGGENDVIVMLNFFEELERLVPN